MSKFELDLMSSIMGGIEQTEEWIYIQMNDPGTKAADSQFERSLKRAEEYLPQEIYTELADANCRVISAYIDVAILYGMRVAGVIQATTANSGELTNFWLKKRMEGALDEAERAAE